MRYVPLPLEVIPESVSASLDEIGVLTLTVRIFPRLGETAKTDDVLKLLKAAPGSVSRALPPKS